MAQTYPYYIPAQITSGQLQKLFRDKKYNTHSDTMRALMAWAKNHQSIFSKSQYVTLEYTSQYECKILGIYTNGTYIYVDKTCEPQYF